MSLPIRKKLVVVGDGGCGKTSLLLTFAKNEFPVDYIPTVFENYVALMEVDDRRVELALWDTAGQEDYDRLRPLSYTRAEVVLICFSLDSPSSLMNVTEKWAPEVRLYIPTIPIILVGNKKDLRHKQQEQDGTRRERNVTKDDGRVVAEKIGAAAYMECSALRREGITEVFQMAAREALKYSEQRKKRKVLNCRIC